MGSIIYEKIRDAMAEQEIGKLFKVAEIKSIVLNKFPDIISQSIQPLDNCYNLSHAKPYDKCLFEYESNNKYKYLGEKYKYTGDIYRDAKKDETVGKWENGLLLLENEEDKSIVMKSDEKFSLNMTLKEFGDYFNNNEKYRVLLMGKRADSAGKNNPGIRAFDTAMLILLEVTESRMSNYNQVMKPNVGKSIERDVGPTIRQNVESFFKDKSDFDFGEFRNKIRSLSEEIKISNLNDELAGFIEENYREIIVNLINDKIISNGIALQPEVEVKESDIVKSENPIVLKLAEFIDKGWHQIILTGAPGTGKTFTAKDLAGSYGSNLPGYKNRYEFVQFHPSYDYTDFVEGLRPVQLDKQTTFVKLDGTFKAFCRKVVTDGSTDKKYFFIVDEINRADLSKVFGELMYALEESYRGENNKVPTQYCNLPAYTIDINGNAQPIERINDVFSDGFFIPKNVYIIGTMNDIDRSVEAFDFALRRRFQWLDIKANEVMDSALNNILKNDFAGKEDNLPILKARAKNLNNCITDKGKDFGLSEAYHLGPSYFAKESDREIIHEEIWKYRIEPILKEYCRGYDSKKVTDFVEECEKVFVKQIDKDNTEIADDVKTDSNINNESLDMK